MEKKFELALVLGRFHPMHNGHKIVVDTARQLAKKTLILIGSSQEFGTVRNPFKVEIRQEIIRKIYGDYEDIVIGLLQDMTNENDICFEWGKYILNNVEKVYGQRPDLMVYGKDESRKGWFSEEDSKTFSEVIIARDKIDISATELRKCLVENQRDKWEKYVPKEIWDKYDALREELLLIEEKSKSSI